MPSFFFFFFVRISNFSCVGFLSGSFGFQFGADKCVSETFGLSICNQWWFLEDQGCALRVPGCLRRLTFAFG